MLNEKYNKSISKNDSYVKILKKYKEDIKILEKRFFKSNLIITKSNNFNILSTKKFTQPQLPKLKLERVEFELHSKKKLKYDTKILLITNTSFCIQDKLSNNLNLKLHQNLSEENNTKSNNRLVKNTINNGVLPNEILKETLFENDSQMHHNNLKEEITKDYIKIDLIDNSYVSNDNHTNKLNGNSKTSVKLTKDDNSVDLLLKNFDNYMKNGMNPSKREVSANQFISQSNGENSKSRKIEFDRSKDKDRIIK